MTSRILAAFLLAAAPMTAGPSTRPEVSIEPVRFETVYETAARISGAPEWILRGIACAESDERDDAIGDGGDSIGRFQLRETFRPERSAKWGEYDARNAVQAGIIAGRVFMENLAALGDIDLAIAAYRQGVRGVRTWGASGWYVERVKERGGER